MAPLLKTLFAAALAVLALLVAGAAGTSASVSGPGLGDVLAHFADDDDDDDDGSGGDGHGGDDDEDSDDRDRDGRRGDGDDEDSDETPRDGQGNRDDDDEGADDDDDEDAEHGDRKAKREGKRKRRRRGKGKRRKKLPPPAPPVLLERFNVKSAAGNVLVRTPAAKHFVELPDDAGLPVGSLVNARKGNVTVTSAANEDGETQTANFRGAMFQVRQTSGAEPVTELVLKGRQLRGCRRAKGRKAASSKRRRKVRRLWGRGKGRFRTRGRRSAATVRGTVWLTEDRCNGTLTRVKSGEVEVHDFGTDRDVTVRAGERYLARAYR